MERRIEVEKAKLQKTYEKIINVMAVMNSMLFAIMMAYMCVESGMPTAEAIFLTFCIFVSGIAVTTGFADLYIERNKKSRHYRNAD